MCENIRLYGFFMATRYLLYGVAPGDVATLYNNLSPPPKNKKYWIMSPLKKEHLTVLPVYLTATNTLTFQVKLQENLMSFVASLD